MSTRERVHFIIDKLSEEQRNNKYPDEFITLPFEAGRTYNKKTGKYEATNKVPIKYEENKGAHIFPVLMR